MGCSKEELPFVASINLLGALTVRVIFSKPPCNDIFNVIYVNLDLNSTDDIVSSLRCRPLVKLS